MKVKLLSFGIIPLIALSFFTYKNIVDVEPVIINSQEQISKIAEYANPKAFITPNELNTLISNNSNVTVIGVLNPIHMNPAISGSFTVWRSDYSADQGEYPFEGMRADQKSMEDVLSNFGATPETTIVVYAANNHHDAGRLYWQIKMLGHKDVRFLDGGLNAWVGANLPTGNENPKVRPTQYRAPRVSENETATYEMVVNAINNPEWVIIDTRSKDEHTGTVTVSGAYGPGTITSSQFINWSDALNEDTTLKSSDELQKIYGDMIKGKKVIAYCQSGVRSAHTTMVLKEILGAQDVFNYDGSWIEWSHAHYEEGKHQASVVNGQKS